MTRKTDDAPVPINLEVPPLLYRRLCKLCEERGVEFAKLIEVTLMNCVRRSSYYELDTKLGFGKYADATAEEVIRIDPGYIGWALKNMDRFELAPACMALLEQMEKASRA